MSLATVCEVTVCTFDVYALVGTGSGSGTGQKARLRARSTVRAWLAYAQIKSHPTQGLPPILLWVAINWLADQPLPDLVLSVGPVSSAVPIVASPDVTHACHVCMQGCAWSTS